MSPDHSDKAKLGAFIGREKPVALQVWISITRTLQRRMSINNCCNTCISPVILHSPIYLRMLLLYV